MVNCSMFSPLHGRGCTHLLNRQAINSDETTHYRSSSMNLKHLAFKAGGRNQHPKNQDGKAGPRTRQHKHLRNIVAVPVKMQMLPVMDYSPENNNGMLLFFTSLWVRFPVSTFFPAEVRLRTTPGFVWNKSLPYKAGLVIPAGTAFTILLHTIRRRNVAATIVAVIFLQRFEFHWMEIECWNRAYIHSALFFLPSQMNPAPTSMMSMLPRR